MTGPLRLASLLMVFALTAPMIRDCPLLLVAPTLPCHAGHTDGVACLANQQAIAESKETAVNSSLSDQSCIADAADLVFVTEAQLNSHGTTFSPISMRPLYLQTGALLI